MSSSYNEAVQALYRAPHESFVAERQRLGAELKTGGDKAAAARLAKLGRPTISAWAVNQLWWHAPRVFEELFETANQLRAGKREAHAAHRKVVTRLTSLAQKLLTENGHATSDATLRRVTMTLSGLAAAGSFDPEPAGALTKDRDPPGFDAFGPELASGVAESAPAQKKTLAKAKRGDDAERQKERAAAASETQRALEAAAQTAAAERELASAERAKKDAERRALDQAVREATRELHTLQHQREGLAKDLAASERKVERAREVLAAAAARRAELDG